MHCCFIDGPTHATAAEVKTDKTEHPRCSVAAEWEIWPGSDEPYVSRSIST